MSERSSFKIKCNGADIEEKSLSSKMVEKLILQIKTKKSNVSRAKKTRK